MAPKETPVSTRQYLWKLANERRMVNPRRSGTIRPRHGRWYQPLRMAAAPRRWFWVWRGSRQMQSGTAGSAHPIGGRTPGRGIPPARALEDSVLHNLLQSHSPGRGRHSISNRLPVALAFALLMLATGCAVPQPRGAGQLEHLTEPTTSRSYWRYLPSSYVKAD